ncbi:uncharacterized protein LOC144350125, partial [Saccoglossus kowalevskii]
PLCHHDTLPEGVIPWLSNLTGSIVSVEWGYGKENCNSEATCLGFNATEDKLMNVQLTPVEIQEGVRLRFVHADMGVEYSIQPYKVSVESFDSCTADEGIPIVPQPISEPIIIDESLLEVGSNYFI